MVTDDPFGREKRWAVTPKRQVWYLRGLGDGFFRRTYNTHTQKKKWLTQTHRQMLLKDFT